MKKLISMILLVASLGALSSVAVANEPSVNHLTDIADAVIQTNQTVDDEGNYVTTFTELDSFVQQVRLNYPGIDDYSIAEFIMYYTGQEYEGLPQEDVLMILKYNNVTVSQQYIYVAEDGSQFVSSYDAIPYDVWTSDDGYLKITTSYAYVCEHEEGDRYDVWARATWLKFPAVRMVDVLSIGFTGAFYSDLCSERGTFSQSYYCEGCAKTTSKSYSVNYSSRVTDGATLAYSESGGVPYLKVSLFAPICSVCGIEACEDKSMSAYLYYEVVANGTETLNAVYGHKTFGVGSISVSFSAGVPTLSVPFGTTVVKYAARGVTVN